jgi:Fe-Mn family superoxide dismutase
MAFDRGQRIDGLSRIVDRDIEILRMNLVQLHDGRGGVPSSAWERLESAWETVRSELADESASSLPTAGVSRGNGASGAAADLDAPLAIAPIAPSVLEPRRWITGVLGPAISSGTGRVVRWSRDPARRAELRAAASKVRSCVSRAALAGAKRVSNAWRRLQAFASRQAEYVSSTWSRLDTKWHAWTKARSQPAEIEASLDAIEVDSTAACETLLLPRDCAPADDLPKTGSDPATSSHEAEPVNVTRRGNGSGNPSQDHSGAANGTGCEESAQARLENAKETVKSKLAQTDGAPRPILATRTTPQYDPPTTSPPDMPFVSRPLPWVLGALSPVISARTMIMHHGSYYAQCIESANRLSRHHKKLAGKSPLEIVRWAREHARGTELLAAASEAWNHTFYWQCLTPGKKRPTGELGKALYGVFDDFSNFADQFALAGAAHVGSGWLWLTANSRKQVKILTTSDADCPEVRGHSCLLAVDLWEHAYYLDHQNRRREYLDALIDRRLDWDFAEQRFRLVLERETKPRRKSPPRAVDRRRARHAKRPRKSATSRR